MKMDCYICTGKTLYQIQQFIVNLNGKIITENKIDMTELYTNSAQKVMQDIAKNRFGYLESKQPNLWQ